MEALEYIKAKNRMTNDCDINCENCPLSSFNNGKGITCRELEVKFPECDIEIVEKWAKEHLPKTYSQDFLEKFPNAPKDINGIPIACKKSIYGGRCDHNCPDCWNELMEET